MRNYFKGILVALIMLLPSAWVLSADLSVTAVGLASQSTRYEQVQFGDDTSSAPFAAVYRDASDNKYYLCDADDPNGQPDKAMADGVVLVGAAADGYGQIVTSGPVTVTLSSGTLDASTTYFTSDTAGGVRPQADLDPNDFTCLLGMPTSTTVFDVSIKPFGHQQP